MDVVRGRAEGGYEAPPIMPFEVYLQDMDVDAYADVLFAEVASLKEVRVAVVSPREGSTRQADRKRAATNASGDGSGGGDSETPLYVIPKHVSIASDTRVPGYGFLFSV